VIFHLSSQNYSGLSQNDVARVELMRIFNSMKTAQSGNRKKAKNQLVRVQQKINYDYG